MKLATAKGVARRLSSVVEGRNGAMIQAALLGDKAERGDMHPALLAQRGDDAFADHGHGGLAFPLPLQGGGCGWGSVRKAL